MVREIVRDTFFLSQKSEKAGMEDMRTVTDLLDTLKANEERCVGMAANMIGVRKTILAAFIKGKHVIMINPEIIQKQGEYETKEGCLSLDGERETKRYKVITVEYYDRKFKKKKQTLRDFEAQIIQHEIDHFNGVII